MLFNTFNCTNKLKYDFTEKKIKLLTNSQLKSNMVINGKFYC